MLHQKADGIAAFAAAKALVYLFGRRNSERRCFFVVKRTEAKIIGTSFFETNKCTDNFYYIYPRLDLLYGMLTDQGGVNIL